MNNSHYIFISPHLDDVALSCGGYVRRLTASGEPVTVVTAITADLPRGAPISKLAQRYHAMWDLGDQPFAPRRDEDAAAMELIGARYLHLGLLDAMYRIDADGRPLYSSIRHTEVHPADWQMYAPCVVQKLNEVFRSYGPDARVFCPLGVGGHVDHLIIRRAVESSCADREILYYEDYPYADQPHAVQPALENAGGLGSWSSAAIQLTPAEVDARVAAIACYRSQVPGLFPSLSERIREIVRFRLPVLRPFVPLSRDPGASHARMVRQLKDYIARSGGERYWRKDS